MRRLTETHPTVTLLYFLSVLGVAMFAGHPVLLLSALIGGMLFCFRTENGAKMGKELGFYCLVFLLVTLTNPLFSHNGVTVLFFLNGNPITLEAIFYGGNLGMTVIGVLYWFKCFTVIMTEEKWLYLFGRVSPKVSLLLSSALRFIPLLKRQGERIRQAQQAMGLYSSQGWTDRLKGTVRVYSALLTWALEKAVDTGSAMKARGYGLKGRSRYSLFRFRKSDGLLLGVILLLDGAVFAVMAAGGMAFAFYPRIQAPVLNGYFLMAMIAYGLMALLPFILEIKEGLQWKYYRSRI